MKRHPSFQGLHYIVADRLLQDGVEKSQAEADARDICDALWRLSSTMRRTDIPLTIKFLRDPNGAAAQLLWLGDDGGFDVAS